MRVRRLLFGSLGIAVLGVALTLADEGPIGTLVGTGVSVAGNDYLFLAAIAGVAVLLAGTMLVSGRSGNVEQTSTPDPEGPPDVLAAGDEFDGRVRSLRFKLPLVGRSVRRATRERLRTAAVEATARSEGCRAAEAERRVAAGTWTDDPAAAACLATDRQLPTVTGHLAAFADGETLAQRRVRRTVEAVVSRSATNEVSR